MKNTHEIEQYQHPSRDRKTLCNIGPLYVISLCQLGTFELFEDHVWIRCMVTKPTHIFHCLFMHKIILSTFSQKLSNGEVIVCTSFCLELIIQLNYLQLIVPYNFQNINHCAFLFFSYIKNLIRTKPCSKDHLISLYLLTLILFGSLIHRLNKATAVSQLCLGRIKIVLKNIIYKQ